MFIHNLERLGSQEMDEIVLYYIWPYLVNMNVGDTCGNVDTTYKTLVFLLKTTKTSWPQETPY